MLKYKANNKWKWKFEFLEFSTGQGLVGVVGDEEELVDDAGDPAADDGPGPVHPVVGPGPAHYRRPEWDCWVHGRAGEGPAGQNVGSHDETNGDWRNCAQISLLWVHGRGIHGVH